ncbi:MAG: hypothetical protein ACEQSK_06955 [Sphingomonadaceae bacterium]
MNQTLTTESIVFDTPDGIEYAGLAGIKYQLKLEKVGMKTRGGPVRPRIAAQLGLRPRASHDDFIAAVEAKMAALRDKQSTSKE